MKGKYINTVIMMAALSGKNRKRKPVNEIVTSLEDHKIIWSKNHNKKAREKDSQLLFAH